MKHSLYPAYALISAITFMSHSKVAGAGAASTTFEGEKTSWHGFDRYDLLMDESTPALRPIKAADDEKDGIRRQIEDQPRGIVVVPRSE